MGTHPYRDYAPPPGPPPGRGQQQQHGNYYEPPPGPPPGRQHDYAPPSGPPPGRQQEYAPPSGPPPGRRDDYAPPPGPPPGQKQQQYDYAPPPGPPPGGRNDFAPPPGPPPSSKQGSGDFAPPPGPPPSYDWAQPPPGPPPPLSSKPQHDWEVAVPDTSLFPPPPNIFSGHDRSSGSNATEDDAIAGEDWCRANPLVGSMTLDPAAHAALEAGNIRLINPTGLPFKGQLNWQSPGHWFGQTVGGSPDYCIIGYPPLYNESSNNPVRTGRPKTIYFEVKLVRLVGRDASVAMGFTALPYPSFRMPGWHRGSLAVHSDDGRKYINDRWGGKDFTNAFEAGETYGIGMTFRPVGGPKTEVEIFFTRGGKEVGRWNLHEESDAEQDLPVTGLEGAHDLSCAVGTFDGAQFEAVFDPRKWLYRPPM